jgi:hypothetical protein
MQQQAPLHHHHHRALVTQMALPPQQKLQHRQVQQAQEQGAQSQPHAPHRPNHRPKALPGATPKASQHREPSQQQRRGADASTKPRALGPEPGTRASSGPPGQPPPALQHLDSDLAASAIAAASAALLQDLDLDQALLVC